MKEKKSITRAGAYALADRVRKAVKLSRFDSSFTTEIFNLDSGYSVYATLRKPQTDSDGSDYAFFSFHNHCTKEQNEAEFGRMVEFLRQFDRKGVRA